VTVPIQAITVREFDPETNMPITDAKTNTKIDAKPETKPEAKVDAKAGDANSKKKKIEQEGVFVIKNGVSTFRRVKTGIVGSTDIEVLDGLTADEEIVTGTFQVLRTLKDNTRIKIEKQQ
jgi:HlyD family secretion protein